MLNQGRSLLRFHPIGSYCKTNNHNSHGLINNTIVAPLIDIVNNKRYMNSMEHILQTKGGIVYPNPIIKTT